MCWLASNSKYSEYALTYILSGLGGELAQLEVGQRVWFVLDKRNCFTTLRRHFGEFVGYVRQRVCQCTLANDTSARLLPQSHEVVYSVAAGGAA